MAQKVTVIDLTKDEELYPSEIAKLEADVASLDKKIDNIRKTVNSFKNPLPDFPASSTRGSLSAPIYTIAPPTMYTVPFYECNAQDFPVLRASLLEKIFSNSTGTSDSRKNGIENSTKVVEESEAEDALHFFNVPMYNGIGCPRMHLEAFLNWVAKIGHGKFLKSSMFVRTLTGHALKWYALQNTLHWPKWDDLVTNFIKQHESPSNIVKNCSPLKRKREDTFASSKGKISEAKASDKAGYVTQFNGKGKAVINNVAIKPQAVSAYPQPGSVITDHKFEADFIAKIRGNLPITPESNAVLFERLKAQKMVHPIRPKNPVVKIGDMTKACIYHSGMLGHDIEGCYTFKEKIVEFIKAGKIQIIPPEGQNQGFVVIRPNFKFVT